MEKDIKKFLIRYKIMCGCKRAYPANQVANLFLDITGLKTRKSFTPLNLDRIKALSELLNFKIEEVK